MTLLCLYYLNFRSLIFSLFLLSSLFLLRMNSVMFGYLDDDKWRGGGALSYLTINSECFVVVSIVQCAVNCKTFLESAWQ